MWFSRTNVFALLTVLVIWDLIDPIESIPLESIGQRIESVPQRTVKEDLDDDGCPTEFQGKCQCGYLHQDQINISSFNSYSPVSIFLVQNGPRYFTICVDSGFTSPKILKHVPNQTEVLIFRGNTFHFLPPHLLDYSKSYNQIAMVDLSNNSIEFIHQKAFVKMENAKILLLNDNQIRVIENGTLESIQDVNHSNPLHSFNKLNWLKPMSELEELQLRNAFSNPDKNNVHRILSELFRQSSMDQLKILNLEHNHIDNRMDPAFFCQFPHLSQLLLAENYLKQFHFDLKCLHQLTIIDLSSNQMNEIDDESFNNIASVGSLQYRWNISNNPFHCDCNMLDSYRWLDAMFKQKNQLINYFDRSGIDQRPTILDWFEQLRCSTPSNMSGKYLQHCDECDQACANNPNYYHLMGGQYSESLELKTKQEWETRNYFNHILEIVLMNTLGVILFFSVFGLILLIKSEFFAFLVHSVHPKPPHESNNFIYQPLDQISGAEVTSYQVPDRDPDEEAQSLPPLSPDQIRMDSFNV